MDNGTEVMIENVVFALADKFPEYDWDLKYEEKMEKYCILVNDWEFYFRDKKFRKWLKILRAKYPKVKFFCAYKNFKH